ncbi:MAG: ABC transporter ATP-binding protein [Pelagibacterales bacterium]|jgi:ABC-type multidrug transport system fused ATPase/permease subunit|nr:ABC transporter ATP-binding protein [Pelagibacterales bacterium]
MKNIKNIIIFVLGSFPDLKVFFTYRFLGVFDILKACTLMLLVTIFEAVSVATFIPLLELLQSEGDLNLTKPPSVWWQYFDTFYKYFGLELNILTLSISIIILVFLRQLMNYLNIVNLLTLKHRVGRDLAMSCLKGIFQADSAYIRNFKTGAFINTIDNQSQSAAGMLRAFATLFGIFLTLVAYFSVMLITSPLASLIAITIMGLIILSVEKWVKVALDLSKDVVNFRESYTNFLGDRYRNWRAIKISSSEDREVALAKTYAKKYFILSVKIAKNSGKNILVVSPIMTVFSLATLYITVIHFNLSISEVAIFILILVRLIPTSQNMANQRQMIAACRPSLHKVINVIKDSASKKENLNIGQSLTDQFEAINIIDVTFTYPKSKFKALSKVTCSIPTNKKTAIIGRSGSGKSTLTDLIACLISPKEGEVKFGSKSSNLFSLRSIRNRITYVSQQPLIFNASVFDNVQYVRPSASREEVMNACKTAKADTFINNLPNKYDEILHESGTNISGGERQRIMLARAFLKESDIIILDEATNSVDLESEEEITKALDHITKDNEKTIIIIAHNMKTIQNIDHLIILDKGKLIAQGKPEELKYDDNWYKKMLEQ